ncbi:AP2 domain transcription factor AP2IV-5, putative [Babesia ovis]|uniref:AP2 domain transcription factor AP2IV-5, putative n=1 Tax=Babesia ovis TaxID=5869 RepID=A0A9W5TAQ9_BABOV|nr:AP2 domain transcription factor AP2IV-5, putative [Babesia ovis]
MVRAAPVRKRKVGVKRNTPNVQPLPSIPPEDYRSHIQGVYYHHTKLEWRATCRDPFNSSKRSQRTFGVRKYGFYEAKLRAEVAAHEWDKHREVMCFLHTISPMDSLNLQENSDSTPTSPCYCNFSPYCCGGYEMYYPGNNEDPSATSSPDSLPLYYTIANQLTNI